MLVLVRDGMSVFHNGVKLTVVQQESKGPDKQVVKIKGLERSNGQQWISLSRLIDGENTITCKSRESTKSQKYSLTNDESEQVYNLQSQIDFIIQTSKDRYVEKPDLDVDPSQMTTDERLEKLNEIKKYYGLELCV